MPEETSATIGIMADSHGDPEAIGKGALFLKQRGCTAIYHLGDICDTTLFQTADACVAQMSNHGIFAVKGNNDHTLVIDARGRPGCGLRRNTLTFLENLPLSLTVGQATLVHSRPFVRRLGLSAMIGMIGQHEARDYFRKHPAGLLLRGHSHKPEMINQKGNEIRFSSLFTGQVIDLRKQRPCIVTSGALAAGLVMIWETESDRLACCTFR